MTEAEDILSEVKDYLEQCNIDLQFCSTDSCPSEPAYCPASIMQKIDRYFVKLNVQGEK